MLEILRNLTRRKLRNTLTIGGITIGILALATMGALAEKTNALLDGGARYFSDHVVVGDATSNGFGGFVKVDTVRAVSAVDGVAKAFPTIGVAADAESGFNFGPRMELEAAPPGYASYEKFKLDVATGVGPEQVTDGKVVLGSDFAKARGLKVGDSVNFPTPPKHPQAGFVRRTFMVVGVLSKTLTAPDNFGYITIRDAQALLVNSIPAAIRGSIDTTTLATGIDVFGKPGTDLDVVANRINSEVPGVKAAPPSELVKSFKSASVIFTGILTGSALLALVVGGLSVINTMLMSVTERYREIGLKKAVGAKTRHIVVEYLMESSLIGFIGGVLGLGLGWIITLVINAATASSNLQLFLLTGRLAAFAMIFAVGLGALAGLVPAFRAARLDPVTALRAQ